MKDRKLLFLSVTYGRFFAERKWYKKGRKKEDGLLLEHIRDKKLKQLYQALTQSDFNGNYEDDYVLSLLYAMRCIDVCQSEEKVAQEREYVDLAKEIIRIADTSDEEDLEDVSILSWTRALFEFMKEEGKTYKDVHRMSAYVLFREVSAFIGKEKMMS